MKKKKRTWFVVKRQGITFFFKYDPEALDLLHIFVRHLATVDEALYVWFAKGDVTWNEKYRRFEKKVDNQHLYWSWMNEEDKKVMIISCFKKD